MKKQRLISGVLLTVLLLVLILAAGTGAMAIAPKELLAIITHSLGVSDSVGYSDAMLNVLVYIRLPRLVLAVLVGSSLAVAGASLQGLFRNPLADPTLIGISSGAALSAVLMIVLLSAVPLFSGGTLLHKYYWLNLFTFFGACMASFTVFRFASSGGKTLMVTLLLTGLAVNALCAAFTSLITYVANDDELRSITFWSMGSLGGASWPLVLSALPFMALPVLVLPTLGKSLNAFSLGEAQAHHLGVNVKRLKRLVLLLSTLSVGAAVATCGIIGFVGLIVPHMLRSWHGADHRSLLLNSALLGAVLMVLADTLSRTIIAPAELPIGIVTALLGTPIFILLLYKQKKSLLQQ